MIDFIFAHLALIAVIYFACGVLGAILAFTLEYNDLLSTSVLVWDRAKVWGNFWRWFLVIVSGGFFLLFVVGSLYWLGICKITGEG